MNTQIRSKAEFPRMRGLFNDSVRVIPGDKVFAAGQRVWLDRKSVV